MEEKQPLWIQEILKKQKMLTMDAIDGVFPALTENGIPEEERRLFYVGMTRAINDLTILCYNGERSSFLAELKPVTFARKAGAAKTTGRQKPTPAVKPAYEYLKPKNQTPITRLSVEEGDRVIHKKYGRGIVVGVKLGENGSAERIRVRIENGEVKLFTALAFLQGIMRFDDGEKKR